MEYLSQITAVPAIVVTCLLIGYCVKSCCKRKDINQYIPSICGVSGAILGLVVFFTTPELISGATWIESLAIGIVSGFAATGIHQMKKQLLEALSNEK